MKIHVSWLAVGSLITASFSLEASPIFSNTISVSEFGGIANTVASLQPGTYINQSLASLRTNDYQNLQSIYSNYASARGITRIGAFLISQGGNSSSVGPNGPGVTFPAIRYVNGTTNPAQNITTNSTTTLLVFSALETSTFTLTGNFGVSNTRQAAQLSYTNPSNGSQSIVDYNIAGNAFHDILYNGMTPFIFADGFTHLQEITVFSTAHPEGQTYSNEVPPNNFALPAGHKFRITVLNTQSNQTQTWLLYLQPPDSSTPALPELQFNAFFNGSGTNILVGQSSFTGFMRLGIVQPTQVPFSPEPGNNALEVPDWSTSLGIQTIAATPAMMYILWPKEFTHNAYLKIQTNFSKSIFLPYCPWLSIYLPVVALNDYSLAQNFFTCLMNDIPPPDNTPYPFDGGTNPFLSYFNMLLAKTYAAAISDYQSSNRAFPSYGITATAATIEAAYDAHRDVIPTNAEFSYTSSNYSWAYTTLIRSGSSQLEPLIIFPAYKTLGTSFTAESGFEVLDATKGPLYATEAQANIVTFKESSLPAFLSSGFIPSDFWNFLSNSDKTLLLSYFNTALTNQLAPGNITALSPVPDGYGNGKFLYQAAFSINYASYLLQQNGKTLTDIKTLTEPTMNAIKSVVEDWLINIQANLRTQQGGAFPTPFVQNFFVGDTTVPGICYSVRGMLGGSDGPTVGQDFGNAAYNDHHFAYGYWLGAIAAVVDWDNTFASVAPNPVTVPWIAQTFTSATGMGPYKMKSFVDVLWRDTRNPDPADPDFPFSRHGNMWEGHSTANGLNLAPYSNGRNEESLAEDFNCWLAVLYYAQSVLKTYNNSSYSGALTSSDVQGFTTLEDFSTINMLMTATAGNLYYKTSNWPYSSIGFNFNVTAAQQFDNLVDSSTFFLPGSPPCNCTSEDAINSPNRLETFYEDYLNL